MLDPREVAREARILAALAMALSLCPALLAQEETKPVILLYHGPTLGEQDLTLYGEALADAIQSDPRIGDNASIIAIGDQDLFDALIHLPQVKCVVIALTSWETNIDRMLDSVLWYFNEGGGLVGLGNVGQMNVAKTLSTRVFPLSGNQYLTVKPTITEDPATGQRIILRRTTYVKDQSHEIATGVPDKFSLQDKVFVIHMNTSSQPPRYEPIKPHEGEYTVVYRDSDVGAPLVVVCEGNGTSVTFAGTSEVSVRQDDDSYFGKILDDASFRKLLQNAVYYVYSKETRFEQAMEKAKANIEAAIQEEQDEVSETTRAQEKRDTARLMRSALAVALGIVLTVIVSYYCFLHDSPREEK